MLHRHRNGGAGNLRPQRRDIHPSVAIQQLQHLLRSRGPAFSDRGPQGRKANGTADNATRTAARMQRPAYRTCPSAPENRLRAAQVHHARRQDPRTRNRRTKRSTPSAYRDSQQADQAGTDPLIRSGSLRQAQ